MILKPETEIHSNIAFASITKWSNVELIVQCDYCDSTYITTAVNYNRSKRNNINQNDCCRSQACITKKKKETFQLKYGVDNPTKCEAIQNKIKQTNITRYGVENPLQRTEIQEKVKQTNLMTYNVENPFQYKPFQEKSQKSCLRKFGTKYASQSTQFKQAVAQTNLSRYGVENPMSAPSIKLQSKETQHKRHGGIGFASNTTRQKIEAATNQRYGNPQFGKTLLSKQLNKKAKFTALYSDLSSGRLGKHIIPLFSLHECNGVGEVYRFKCNHCQIEFSDSLDDGNIPLCPTCNPQPTIRSKTENELFDFLRQLLPNIEIQRNNRRMLNNNFELDFFIPSLNVAIELNGNYFHSELGGKKNKTYHLSKTLRCEEQNIQLIHIFEDEWLLKQDIVKSMLQSKLIKQNRIFGRKCEVKEVSFKQKSIFLDSHHLQGDVTSQYNLGAFFNDELIAVMTFSQSRFSQLDKIELTRFCSSVATIGVAGKLLKFFIRQYNPARIVTYANRRYSLGGLYESLDFTRIAETPPSFYYIHRKQYLRRIHRLSFRKSVQHTKLPLFNDELTGWQNMQLNGYDRIWDCGHFKYELNLS